MPLEYGSVAVAAAIIWARRRREHRNAGGLPHGKL
jgi:hypothetical protein